MEVLLINPPFKSEYGKYSRDSRSPAIAKSGTIYYPIWLLYTAGILDIEGFDVKFVDAPAKQFGISETIEIVKNMNPRLIVINTSTPSIYSDVHFGESLKELFPKSYIALVGTHPSALPEETLKLSRKIDAVARHEYDYIIRDLACALRDNTEIEQVNGITYWDHDEIISTQNQGYIENLDELPFISKSIKKFVDYHDYFFSAASYPEIQIITGRGCVSKCFFCVYPQTFHSHNYRFRSSRNVVSEFEYIIQNFPDVKEIGIEDDTFTSNKARVIEICNLLIEKGIHKKIKWYVNARVNLDFETMKLMKKAGCRLLIPGIESGDQQILNNIKKGIKVEQSIDFVKNAKKAGLLVHACFMVGNKGETKESMEKTLNLAKKLNPDTAQFFPMIPYPGTEAFAWAVKSGYIDPSDYSKWLKEDGEHNCVLNFPDISSDQLVDFCDYARRKFYLRPRYILYKLMQILKSKQEFIRTIKSFKNFVPYLLGRR